MPDATSITGYSLLPNKPGIYKFFNNDDELIYVGKAKDIRKRVASYFNKGILNRKTFRLASEVDRIEFALSGSEFDAFLLENSLIKENQPKYNIRLKDDKSFPYVCVSNERFPRIYSTRRHIPSDGRYYGPYTSVVAMNSVLDLIRRLYTIRTCKYNLSEKNIAAGKFKVCLEYHIGNCLGPCEGLQSEEDYDRDIEQAELILKGKISTVRRNFKSDMEKYASELNFELAQVYKDKLQLLNKFQSSTVVVNPKLGDIQVCTITSDDNEAFVNYLRVRNGAINYTKSARLRKKLDEPPEEIVRHALFTYGDLEDVKKSVFLSNVDVPGLPNEIEVHVPTRGDKRKLVELSLKNTLQLKQEFLSTRTALKGAALETLSLLQQDLNLKELPVHIECFDNSNLQGSDPVAAMVCFRNGKPSKKDYRHFNIKTVVGPDDFSSMEEIVYRRYRRLVDEESPLPNLIVIDGGKGQLGSAVKALQDIGIYGQIPVIGIAKKLEEIYFPDDPLPLHISKKSVSLKLIQRLRDEAHRFAIDFHRRKRSKSTIKTQLEQIPGVGKATADKLLKKFKSMKKVRAAGLSELQEIVGPKAAAKIKEHLE